MKKLMKIASMAAMAVAMSGCYTNMAVDRASKAELINEGSVTFVRPRQYSMWFGSYSPREFFEIVYERASRNEAGFLVVEVGIRYRGGQGWTNWSQKMPETITLGAQCNFYDSFNSQVDGVIVYSTNKEPLVFGLGRTYAFKAICPVRSAQGYQLVLGGD